MFVCWLQYALYYLCWCHRIEFDATCAHTSRETGYIEISSADIWRRCHWILDGSSVTVDVNKPVTAQTVLKFTMPGKTSKSKVLLLFSVNGIVLLTATL